jgi:hypothetical protein
MSLEAVVSGFATQIAELREATLLRLEGNLPSTSRSTLVLSTLIVIVHQLNVAKLINTTLNTLQIVLSICTLRNLKVLIEW